MRAVVVEGVQPPTDAAHHDAVLADIGEDAHRAVA
jgi:hypothetical protein